MVSRVRLTVDELSPRPVRVSGGGVTETVLAVGETRAFEATGALTLEETDAPVGTAPAPGALPGSTPDVFSKDGKPQHDNPNGIVRADIAPKLPKASGELQDVNEGGIIVQRPVVEGEGTAGRSTQGGGPEAEATDGGLKTPGPQPTGSTTSGAAGGVSAAATGDVDARGAPAPRTKETLEQTASGKPIKPAAAKKAAARK